MGEFVRKFTLIDVQELWKLVWDTAASCERFRATKIVHQDFSNFVVTNLFSVLLNREDLLTTVKSDSPGDNSAIVVDLKCLKIWDFLGKKWADHSGDWGSYRAPLRSKELQDGRNVPLNFYEASFFRSRPIDWWRKRSVLYTVPRRTKGDEAKNHGTAGCDFIPGGSWTLSWSISWSSKYSLFLTSTPCSG